LEFDVNKRLITILADVFGLRESEIYLDLKKEDVDNWDSLKQMDLVLSLEREYGISLEIPDILQMTSVSGIVEVLKGKGADLGN
jgi:acyl carrier protein